MNDLLQTRCFGQFFNLDILFQALEVAVEFLGQRATGWFACLEGYRRLFLERPGNILDSKKLEEFESFIRSRASGYLIPGCRCYFACSLRGRNFHSKVMCLRESRWLLSMAN